MKSYEELIEERNRLAEQHPGLIPLLIDGKFVLCTLEQASAYLDSMGQWGKAVLRRMEEREK